MFIEDLGYLFKGDPTFEYAFHSLPQGMFMKLVELRRKRLEKAPQLNDILG